MEKVKAALDEIWARQPESRTIIAIDGLSRSGKTTLSDRMAEYLSVQNVPYKLFHIDDLIVERKRRYGTGRAEWQEYYFMQWEIETLQEQFLGKLKTETEISLAFYNAGSDSHVSKKIRLPATGIVLIEGVFLQRPEWRPNFDAVFYLDCPKEQRFERESEAAKRNSRKLADRYWAAEQYYEETVRPKERADWVIQSGREIGETT
ncbi:kinase [Planococcus sp. FY231025]|uniref:kinase n=1 Tax=Planococcus sp. FY231025 TaxID=3455699 RepID=UPI003F91E612